MKLWNALFKTVAHKANRIIYEKRISKAKRETYEETGHLIQKAKKQHKYINGSAIYNKKLEPKVKKAKDKKDDNDCFLNNL